MTTLIRKAGLLAAAAVLGSLPGMVSFAAEPFQPILDDTTAYSPRGNGSTTVIVILAGESVAVVQKNMGRKLTDGERKTIIGARYSDHEALRSRIEGQGGTVLAHLHSALNGIKIKIAKNRLAALRRIPGVIDIMVVGTYERVNTNAIPLIGAPQAWQSLGTFRGEGVKIGIIDTGIDYTHANFGGPGTLAAYSAAFATNTAPANPAWFGPGAPKVKGGYDLVGDAYNGGNRPVPDSNPLDCPYTSGNVGHGSHVAGTATGLGVTAAGSTYTGPYNASIYTPGAFRIGPGVAPKADLYSYRVFGCSGSTNVVAEAIDRAVADGMDVISMSLGSNYGVATNGDPGRLAEGAAVAAAAAAGIVVVAASGNAGPVPYITSAPAVFEGAISVAATDALAGVPTANLALSLGPTTISVQNSNGGAYVNGTNYQIRVLRNPDGSVSQGCNPNEYDPAMTGVPLTGKMVVAVRGTCARVFRAGAAQHFGAAAAALINSAPGLPPYEGPIPGGAPDPNSGNIYEPVTIPFFGVAQANGPAISGPSGVTAPGSATATSTGISPNAGFEKIARFSSMGPRIGDSALRPGVTAPGVSVVSTASGSGNGFEVLSGTSMATPGVAGVAALTVQAHPTWNAADLRAAVVQTANPTLLKDYLTRNEGAGLVQAQSATLTQAVVRTPDESVSFGFADLLSDFSGTKNVTLHNFGTKAVQFNIGVTKVTGPASVTVTTPATVVVNANSDAVIPVGLNVVANSVGGGTAFQDIGGTIKLTPANAKMNSNVSLSVPYYLVAHSRSNLAVSSPAAANASGDTVFSLTNAGGALTGTPDVYALGQYQGTPQGVVQGDVRAVGAAVSGSTVLFAINTHNRTSTTLAFQEFDICIDTTGGAGFHPNKVLIGINGTALSSSTSVRNKFTVALFPADASCNTTGGGQLLFTVPQPTDNSTLLLPVPRGGSGNTGLGLTAGSPRFKYSVSYFARGSGATMPGVGAFNAFTPAVALTAGGAAVPAGGAGSATVTVNAAEQALSPALGVMVLAPDNVSGASQAVLIPIL